MDLHNCITAPTLRSGSTLRSDKTAKLQNYILLLFNLDLTQKGDIPDIGIAVLIESVIPYHH